MEKFSMFGLSFSVWGYAGIVYLLWVILLFSIKRIFYHRIMNLARKTESKIDDVLLKSLKMPLALLILGSGIVIAARVLPLDEKQELAGSLFVAFRVLTIIALIIFLDGLLRNATSVYREKLKAFKVPPAILRGLVRTAVLAIGLMVLLESFGISITPLLASLGIGSLAVALALQPTLENFFAGVQIAIDRPINVGDFVKLDTGEEGYVEKVGWRSSWIRMLPNNVVVVPNKVLVNTKILNYYYPSKDLAVLVNVGVHYDSDLKKVEEVTIEVAREVMKTISGGVADFEPFIRYHTFGDFSINFTVIMRAKEFVDNYLIKHEFIKRLHERYKKEGIVIPYPIRSLYMERAEKAAQR